MVMVDFPFPELDADAVAIAAVVAREMALGFAFLRRALKIV
jgi:hypothetical protein